MGQIRIFEIQLVDEKTVYFPGDVVRGTCIIDLAKELKLKFLRVAMKGRAKVFWTENSNGETEYYQSRIDYFTYTQILFGNEDSSVENTLLEGRNEFHFAFNLPMEGICMSFEGKHGNIRYKLEAEIGQKWKLSKKKFRKGFIVSTITDINRLEFQVPVQLSAEKVIGTLCCKSGLVLLTALITRTGYCPGESVGIWAEFSNKSSRTIVPYAILRQNQIFYAQNNITISKSTLAEVRGSPLNANDQTSWNDMFLAIPSTPPTLKAGIITVEYYVKVSLSIPYSRNLSLRIPITLGNVAYNEGQNYQFDVHPQIPMSSTSTDMHPQFPMPPFNSDLQIPLPVAPTDMFLHFPIFDPIADRDVALLPNISSVPDGSYPSHGIHAHTSEPPPPYQDNSVNPSSCDIQQC